ncbi:hypothetical protein COU37_01985 [Candidatus Micrarchaeota archaeon CG10_big_fil_rev_8_21_14_0_10_45_29]|nr:MAG: hypothetical protein COU37_01985 [Candidatus Micrarchaeota archaeon CG10_big_fil_rev_8_21_14_0_10_45_29]
MDEDVVIACIRKWALKMTAEVKLAIPAKVADRVMQELSIPREERKKIIAMAREVCTKINNMDEAQLADEMEKYSDFSEGTQIYE